MELIKLNINNNNIPDNVACCVGEFDGIHKAHMQLVNEVKRIGKEKGYKTAMLTFYPHPGFVLNKKSEERYITPLKEKEKLVKEIGLDYLIVIEFTKELAALDYEVFYEKFLKKLKYIVTGFDFHFGYMGKGDHEYLQRVHKNVSVIDRIGYKDEKLGSTLIIKYITEGKMDEVYQTLGRYYKISGTVVDGSKIGSKIGFPTANVLVTDKYYHVKQGVYAVRIKVNNEIRLGIANFGYNPSFNEVKTPRLEIFILDFNENIYNKNIEVEFLSYMRDEKVFPSIKEFQDQLTYDSKWCKDKFGGIL